VVGGGWRNRGTDGVYGVLLVVFSFLVHSGGVALLLFPRLDTPRGLFSL